jgi:hypothetical protein
VNWYQLELKGLDDVTDRAWREVWKVAYEHASRDPTNAIFRSRRGAASTLYFTPSAAELAVTFGAERCKKPSAEKLVFVAGAAEACNLHFPRRTISRPAVFVAVLEVPPSSCSTVPFSAFATTQFG